MPVARIKLMIIGLFGGVQGHSDGRGEVAVETSRHLASQLAMEQAGSNDATGVIHVSTPTLVLTAIPLFFIAFLGHRLDLGLTNELIIGVIRCFVQLMILGMILHPIFVMGMGWPWLVGLYVLFMTLIATKESVSNIKYTYQYHSLMTFLALLLSIISVGAFSFLCIVRPEPRWNPQYVIPMCGMLMGNCISGVKLTVKHLTTQIMEGGRREIELCLSFGASGWQSLRRQVNEAVGAGVTPLVNSLNVIGLVAIPGMMTGQILGGSPVTEAAHYQILIMYLISTCTFIAICFNMFIIYRVAFDAGTHVLRTDRFIEVVDTKQNKKVGIMQTMMGFVDNCCCPMRGRSRDVASNSETQPLQYGSSKDTNTIKILTREVSGYDSEPMFRIANLAFSVQKSHQKKSRSDPDATSLHQSPSSSAPEGTNNQLQSQQRVLCTNLTASFKKGEIGIVRGPSGCGKTTLLRVLAGLTPLDDGDVMTSGLSLSACYGRGDGNGLGHDIIQWRTTVRYVTQNKADLPGTPRDFIARVASFHISTFEFLSEDEMLLQTMSYLDQWGMGGSKRIEYSASLQDDHHPYLDKEWKTLSGGESQRMLLAIAMASRATILLLDEATSGLDNEMEKIVENSVVEYSTKNGAVVLWVTHSDDIAERLLASHC